jgi:exosome complex RNA-binding protein Rrp42 (RNase PH superfamily)
MDGDLLDSCSVVTLAALQSTIIPKIELQVDQSGKPIDFEVSGDISEGKSLNTTKVPIIISVCKVKSVLEIDDMNVHNAII